MLPSYAVKNTLIGCWCLYAAKTTVRAEPRSAAISKAWSWQCIVNGRQRSSSFARWTTC